MVASVGVVVKSQNSQEAFLCSIERIHDNFRPKGQVCLDTAAEAGIRCGWQVTASNGLVGSMQVEVCLINRCLFHLASVQARRIRCVKKNGPATALSLRAHTHIEVLLLSAWIRRKREAGRTEHAILCSSLNTLFFYHSAGHSNPADQIPQSPRASDGA